MVTKRANKTVQHVVGAVAGMIVLVALAIFILAWMGSSPTEKEDTGHPPPNTITYSDLDINEIIREINFVDSIFKKACDDLGIRGPSLGYIANDTTFYFRHCLAPGESAYLPVSICNIDTLLTIRQQNQLRETIHSLRKKRINSNSHFYNLSVYHLKVDYNDLLDGRYLCLTRLVEADTVFNIYKPFDILDQKKGLTLLKNKS